MRLRNSFCNRWRLPIFIFVMTAFMFPGCGASFAANKKEEKKKETPKYVVTGRDPKAFANASTLLATPNQKFLDDQEADMLIGSLQVALRKENMWSSAIWSQLDRLRSVRISAMRVQLLQNVAQRMSVNERRLSRDKSAAARRAFKQGNRYYEAGKFKQSIESYRSALNEHPAYWDAWNNMALAEMHRNNDLLALFLLTALIKSNPHYTGASINLSVCFERLRMNAAAYKVATDLASEKAQMPMAQYNMAWFENSRGKYDSASGYLEKALAAVDDYSVAKWLQTINTMESGRNVTDDEMKWLPQADQAQGIPKVKTRSVIVDRADAYSGNTLVAKIPRGSKLVISQESWDWYSVYWPVEDVKRRLWVRKASLGRERTVQSASSEEYATFLGVWIDPSTKDKFTVKDVNGKPRVVATNRNDEILNSTWSDGKLSWTYKVSSTGYRLSFKTVKVTSKSMKCTWSNDHGAHGTEILKRTN